MLVLITRANPRWGGTGVSVVACRDGADVGRVVEKWKLGAYGHLYMSHRIADESEFPSDYTFRSAWEDAGTKIVCEMSKAKMVHRHRLRVIRAPLMVALDVEYMRADELGDTAKKSEIAAKKQALRDVTKDPAIEAARTPEELKTVLPNALK